MQQKLGRQWGTGGAIPTAYDGDHHPNLGLKTRLEQPTRFQVRLFLNMIWTIKDPKWFLKDAIGAFWKVLEVSLVKIQTVCWVSNTSEWNWFEKGVQDCQTNARIPGDLVIFPQLSHKKYFHPLPWNSLTYYKWLLRSRGENGSPDHLEKPYFFVIVQSHIRTMFPWFLAAGKNHFHHIPSNSIISHLIPIFCWSWHFWKPQWSPVLVFTGATGANNSRPLEVYHFVVWEWE